MGLGASGRSTSYIREHGRALYVRGCRCAICRQANTDYAHYRKHRTARAQFGAANPLTVHALHAVEQIDRLRSHGWTLRRIAAATGIGRDHLARIQGRTARPLRRVRWATYAALRDLPDDPQLASGALVDATGTWRRLEALVALGYPQTFLAGELGLGRALQINRRQVTSRNAEKVAAMYERLSGVPGPSERTRTVARRKGYAPPLAWDDDTIDDPAALPDVGEPDRRSDDVDHAAVVRILSGDRPSQLRRADRVEAVRVLVFDRGVEQTETARLLGLHVRQVNRDVAELRSTEQVAS